jgi:phospholipid/cholesterol/gamma-HCH transport system ATP-binding protein
MGGTWVYNWGMSSADKTQMDKPEPIIELRGVSLSFDTGVVFDNFNMSLHQGDSLVLVGPSGSGKSTLLKLMAGLVRPDHGEVLYRGEPFSTLSKTKRLALSQELGFLFQQNALFDSMTVYENLFFPLNEIQPQRSLAEKHQSIVELLKAVGLDHVLDHYPSEISGGMQKRLGIARALILQPQVVFYDDPTAGLDPITSRKIIQLILDLKAKTRGTIVTVTHDMMRAYQLAGTIWVCFLNEFTVTGSASQTKHSTHPKVQQFIRGDLKGPLEMV